MGFGGIYHVIAAFSPVANELLYQRWRMLAVPVHEQHCGPRRALSSAASLPILRDSETTWTSRESAGSVRAIESVASLERHRHRLPRKRVHDAAAALWRDANSPMQRGKSRGLAMCGDDNRQPLRRGSHRCRGQARDVATEHHRSDSQHS